MNKYLARNRDGKLVVFSLVKGEPTYDEEMGEWYFIQPNGFRFTGTIVKEIDDCYKDLKCTDGFIGMPHIPYLCDECNSVSREVVFQPDPFKEEVGGTIEYINLCPNCYTDYCNEI